MPFAKPPELRGSLSLLYDADYSFSNFVQQLGLAAEKVCAVQDRQLFKPFLGHDNFGSCLQKLVEAQVELNYI